MAFLISIYRLLEQEQGQDDGYCRKEPVCCSEPEWNSLEMDGQGGGGHGRGDGVVPGHDGRDEGEDDWLLKNQSIPGIAGIIC